MPEGEFRERDLVNFSRIVLAFRGYGHETDADAILLYHLGLMYWNPYRAALHQVRLCDAPEREELPANTDRMYVRPTSNYFSLPKAFEPMPTRPKWQVCWYQLEWTTCALSHVDPSRVPVVFLGETGHSGDFWPPPPRPAKQRAPRKQSSTSDRHPPTPTVELIPVDDVVDDEGQGEEFDPDDVQEMLRVARRGVRERDADHRKRNDKNPNRDDKTIVEDPTDVEVPEPKPPLPPDPVPRRDRKRADAHIVVAGGKLSFYKRYNNYFFYYFFIF